MVTPTYQFFQTYVPGTAYTPGVFPLFQFSVAQSGTGESVPAAGYLLFTYAAGTTTKQATYTDATGATEQTNPVVLDANGVAPVWLLGQLNYKFVVSPPGDTDPPTNPIYTIDNIPAASLPGQNYLIWPPYGYGPGAYTWVCPVGVTTCKLRMVGGGAAGGNGNSAAGPGGGAGGYLEGVFPVSSGVTYTITVGAGGVGGVSIPASEGGATTFAGGGLSLYANGGTISAGGTLTPGYYPGGVGGSAGQTGTSYNITALTGGSGGQAFISQIGTTYLGFSGSGGNAPYGGEGGNGLLSTGATLVTPPSVQNGSFPGGGGAGGIGTLSGANGASGSIIMEY